MTHEPKADEVEVVAPASTAKHVGGAMSSVGETAVSQVVQHMRDVYGPAMPYDGLPEGTTVGTTFQFVGISIGYNREHLLLPDEADRIADLLREAATKCRSITEAEKREHAAELADEREG